MKAASFLAAALCALVAVFSEAAHIIKDKDEAHHVTQRVLKRQGGFKHKHADVQALRDEYHQLKAKAHEEDPGLVEALAHPNRKRSAMDEIKMRRLEKSVRGEAGGLPTKKVRDLKQENSAKKRANKNVKVKIATPAMASM
jgi:hypothetical protein